MPLDSSHLARFHQLSTVGKGIIIAKCPMPQLIEKEASQLSVPYLS
jgi:hypothetical protein